MVFPVGGTPDSTPKTQNTAPSGDGNVLSHRQIYNEAGGIFETFKKSLVKECGYHTEDDKDIILQIFNYLQNADKSDGKQDGNLTALHLKTELTKTKEEYEAQLTELNDTLKADINFYNTLTTEEDKEAYLKQCLMQNAGWKEYEISDEALDYAKNIIQYTQMNIDALQGGIEITNIDLFEENFFGGFQEE